LVQEVLPNGLARLLPQCFVLQGKVHPAKYRFVECLQSVCGEKQNAIVLFQLAQEHRDQGVDLRIVRTLCQEHIRFIKEQ